MLSIPLVLLAAVLSCVLTFAVSRDVVTGDRLEDLRSPTLSKDLFVPASRGKSGGTRSLRSERAQPIRTTISSTYALQWRVSRRIAGPLT